MEEKMYELLNDMDQHLNRYKEEEISKTEVKKVMRAFRKRRYEGEGRRAVTRKNVRIAAAFLILFGVGVFTYNPVSAQVNMIAYHIRDYLGIKTDVSSYTTAINKVVSRDGIAVSLDEVIIDEKSMHIIYSVKYLNVSDGKPLEDSEPVIDSEPYIDGRFCFGGCHGEVSKGKAGEDIYSLEIRLDDVDTAKEGHYKIVFRNDKGKKIGAVSFIASGKELLDVRKRTSVNHNLTLENGIVLKLDELVSSPVQYRVNVSLASGKSEEMKYDVTLKGHDNLGRKMEFYMSDWDDEAGTLILFYTGDENVDMTGVTSFVVVPYVQEFPEESGCMDTEIKQAGEEFTITVNEK